MNEYDSQRMAQVLQQDYRLTIAPEEADVILINTCSIRKKPENKVYSLVGRYKCLKDKKPDLIIGVGGCVAQQEGQRILERMPYVDLVFGPQAIHRLPRMLEDLSRNKTARICATPMEKDFEIPSIKGPLPDSSMVRTFVTIMQGCDNFCTYCIVPFVRGRETSRPPGAILEEIRRVVSEGIKEVTLLGQNVNSYGKKNKEFPDFAELLRLADRIDGLRRLRFTTSHPKDLSESLINCFGQLETLCEHLHLPVQSGSSRVLKRMNRRYDRTGYLTKVERLRKACPDISLTTDLIVGFPGESERDFQDTLSLLKIVEYDQIFAFKYSPRPGTRAAEFEDQIDEEEKSRRLAEVLDLQREIGSKRFKALENTVQEVLIESADQTGLKGRTRGNHVVHLKGNKNLVGKLVMIRIDKAGSHSLQGSIIPNHALQLPNK